MAVQQTEIKREFKYNSLQLTDPSVSKTPDQVRMFFAAMYPELATAVVEGPVTKKGVSTYTFMRAAGSKGSAHGTSLQSFVRQGVSMKGNPLHGASLLILKDNKKCSSIVSTVVNNRSSSTPILPSAEAYSLFG